MNQNYDPNFCYNPIYSGFDQIQSQQFSTVQLLEIERINKEESFKKKDMGIEEIMSEKRLIDDEINDITNDLSYKRFRGEKIDDEYERDCTAVGEVSAGRGWSSKGASTSDGTKYSGYSGSGDGGATGCMGSPSYPYTMTSGGPPSDGSSSAP
ncbi:hypothetical protein Tco_0930647 [Tanacetum coccineum]